jgi:hypothetical protein
VLQPRLVDVEVHLIDALHLKGHVPRQDIGDAASYRHHRLRSWVRPIRAPIATGGLMPGTTLRVSPAAGAYAQPNRRHDSLGWGEAPLVLDAGLRPDPFQTDPAHHGISLGRHAVFQVRFA